MAALVLKKWLASDSPVDANNNFVIIVGRKSGFISWLLTLAGIDPTTTMKIGVERIEFHESSLSGTNNRMIPLQSVCSTYYGYYKPWQIAILITLIFVSCAMALVGVMTQADEGKVVLGILALVVGVLGPIISFAYYYLNRTLTLGFVENSGVINGIRFKRSVIENIDVNEAQANLVCSITQALIEQKTKR